MASQEHVIKLSEVPAVADQCAGRFSIRRLATEGGRRYRRAKAGLQLF